MFLHPHIIYGPVKSRRLGSSLGINLLPPARKVCNYECVYCECGWSDSAARSPFPDIADLADELEEALKTAVRTGQFPDHLTFSGNGEPTLHPEFSEAMEVTVRLRDKLSPTSKIVLLTNGTTAGHPGIFRAMMRTDKRIVKFDAGTESMFKAVNIPVPPVTFNSQMEMIQSFGGQCIIQSMFIRGEYGGIRIDNTAAEEVNAWLQHLTTIKPESVMLYSLDRVPPAPGITAVNRDELSLIAGQVRSASLHCDVY